MIYELFFDKKALEEWQGLDNTIKQQFKKKLKERLENPCVRKDKLSGHNNAYKIKLRNSGYRLAYIVNDQLKRITVMVIGKRDNNTVYRKLKNRIINKQY